MTDPGSGPDVGSDLEDWQLEHEVDAGHELGEAAEAVDEAADQVEDVTHSTAAAKFQT
jgi:hypothetical protein